MKKTIILILFSLNICNAQEDTLKFYYPLNVGNYWQYKVTHISSIDTPTTSYKYTKIVKDTILEIPSKTFYKIKVAFSGFPLSDTIKYLRYDPISNSILEYLEGERILFKLSASLNECWEYFSREICYSNMDTITIFNQIETYESFSQYDIPSWAYYLVRDFGPVRIVDNQSFVITNYFVYDLVYAKINGIEYGSYVTSIDYGNQIPISYSLSQNYPNPFNPTTTFTFNLPIISFVTLKVFDILGKEVATIISEEMPAGNYSRQWNATNMPSGVYFYRLQAGSFAQTKKLILLK